MKDEIPLAEIRLFSRRPDEVGFETLISTIDRLLEIALVRINEQEGREDYRRGLLWTAVSVIAKESSPVEPEAPIAEPESPMVDAPRKPGRPKAAER